MQPGAWKEEVHVEGHRGAVLGGGMQVWRFQVEWVEGDGKMLPETNAIDDEYNNLYKQHMIVVDAWHKHSVFIMCICSKINLTCFPFCYPHQCLSIWKLDCVESSQDTQQDLLRRIRVRSTIMMSLNVRRKVNK